MKHSATNESVVLDTGHYFEPQSKLWAQSCDDEDFRFLIVLILFLALTTVAGIVISLIDLPETSIEKLEKESQKYAKVFIKTKVKPKPKPKPKLKKIKPVEEKKPKKIAEKKKPPKKKPVTVAKKPKPKPKPIKKPSAKEVAAARKKAQSSGVVALSDMLADMRQLSNTQKEKRKPNQPLKKIDANKVAKLEKSSAVQAVAYADSGGKVNAATQVSSATNFNLEQTEREIEWANVEDIAEDNNQTSQTGSSENAKAMLSMRDEASIRRIFDQNKGAIDALYRRALRKDSTLQGRVTIEVIIEPSGVVSECKIVESELEDEKLEKRLITRISLIQFGEQSVERQRIQYSFDFLPS